MLQKVKISTIVCGLMFLASVFYFLTAMELTYWSAKYAPGPGFLPRWAGGAMVILTLIAFIQSFKEEGITLAQVLPNDKRRRVNLYVCWAGLILYVAFVQKIGFSICSTLLLAAMFSRGTKWYKALLAGVVVTACCYLVFVYLLGVQLPSNQFGWLGGLI